MSELEFCIGKKTIAFEFLERTHFKVDPYDGHTWMRYASVITYGFGLIGSGVSKAVSENRKKEKIVRYAY